MEDSTRKLTKKFVQFGFLFLTLLFASGWLGKWFWFLDVISNFRILFLFAFLISFICLHLIKSKKLYAINAIIIILIFCSLAKFYIPQKTNKALKTDLKLSSINLEKSNSDILALESLISTETPDVLLLMEVTPKWLNLFNNSEFTKSYPYEISEPREGYFGMVMYSKYPLLNQSVIESGKHRLPSIKADIKIKNKRIAVIGTHPPPPINKDHFIWRNNQFKEINKLILDIKSPLILMGDFNSTTYSTCFKSLTKATNLKDSRVGKGLQPSWSIFNKNILPLALDHIFVSKEIIVKKRHIGQNINSDHLPVFTEICIK